MTPATANPRDVAARSAFGELRALEQKVRAAEAAVQDAELAKRRAQRERDAVAGEIQAYWAGIAEGAKPDPKRLEALKGRTQELQAGLVARSVSDGRVVRIEMVDVAADGQIAGAFAAVEEAKGAVAAFIVDERDRLQAELVERSIAARDALMAGVEAFFGAVSEWRRVRAEWIEVGERWDIAPGELPLTPFDGVALQDIQLAYEQARGGARDPRGMFPMPPRLAPGSEDPDRVEYPGSLRGWAHVPRVMSSEGGPGA